MGAQHTQGPWKTRGHDGWDVWQDSGGHSSWAVGSDEKLVAILVTTKDWDDPEFNANAHLLAAAPETLAALVVAQHQLKSLVIGRGDAGGSCALCSATWEGIGEAHKTGCLIAMNDVDIARAEGR